MKLNAFTFAIVIAAFSFTTAAASAATLHCSVTTAPPAGVREEFNKPLEARTVANLAGYNVTVGVDSNQADGKFMYAYLNETSTGAEARWIDYAKGSNHLSVGLFSSSSEAYLNCEIRK